MSGYPTEFIGDGRVKVEPLCVLPGTQPMPLTRSQCRQTVDRLNASARSFHSGTGSTLWAVLWYLAWKKQPYTLRAYPGMGYQIDLGRREPEEELEQPR